jgi:hypothetical protein
MERRSVRAAAITFAYNESFNLQNWIRYFGSQIGTKNLFVVDHGTNDGSTDDLGDVNRIALPHNEFDDNAKTNFVNGLQHGLLNFYDTVIYTDADELVVPDPALYPNLTTYLEQRTFDYVSCVGLNIIHMLSVEEPLELAEPILQQRRFAKFASAGCKPAVTRVPMTWAPGFHSSNKPPQIDPALFMFHMKWVDYNITMQRHRLRRESTYTPESVEKGMGAHFRYDYERSVREGFFSPINEMKQRGIAQFDFSVEIETINAAAAVSAGLYTVPMKIGKIVEIPERFRSLF